MTRLRAGAARTRAAFRDRPSLSLAVVLVLLLAGIGLAARVPAATTAATRGGSGGTGAAGTSPVPVARATGTCPDPAVDSRTATSVDIAAPGPLATAGPGARDTDSAGSGRAGVTRVSGRGAALAGLDVPSTARVAATAGGVPLLAAATDALAPGFAASMTTRSTGAELRGLSGTTCLAPGTDFWFVGSGAVIGQRGRVYLTNPEPVAAVADVTLYGPDGPIDAPTGRGVAVAARGQQVLKLDALAPDVPHLGVHVLVRQGRLSAAVRDQQVEGLTPRGADWLPASVAPARRLVLPGVVAGAGERRLMVVVPGDTDAILRVRIVGDDGGFVPSGLDVVEARSGRLTDLDLATYAGGRSVSVELTADRPVVAGLLSEVGVAEDKASEIAYTAAAERLTRGAPGVVPDLRGRGAGSSVRSQLLITAPGDAATVELTPIAPATGGPRRVAVPADSQVAVDATTLSDSSVFGVLVRPVAGSPPVVAARETSESDPSGTFVTTALVAPPRYRVQVPPVVADLSTGLGQPGPASPSSRP